MNYPARSMRMSSNVGCPTQSGDGGSTPTRSLQFEVRLIDWQTAKPFICQWHYSRSITCGKNIYFGTYLGDTLYAVANYGDGINQHQAPYLARTTGLPITKDNLVELKRLCRIEPKMDLPLTKFLKVCHGMLRKQGIKYVVSFSDPAEGHTGGIYKAANFQHLGKTDARWHLIGADGITKHRRHCDDHSRSRGITPEQSRIMLGFTKVMHPQKDRWFLCL